MSCNEMILDGDNEGAQISLAGSHKLNFENFQRAGEGAFRSIGTIHSNTFKDVKFKTTDDIIKKGNQQTYVERLQKQRMKANSLPSKRI